MPFMLWKEEYNTGIKKIDSQHKRFVDLINKLHSALSAGKEQETLYSLLSELLDYTKRHFEAEEKIMANLGFVELEGHRAHHQDLIDQITIIIDPYLDGKFHVNNMFMVFLKSWYSNHIFYGDADLASFVKVSGTNRPAKKQPLMRA